MNDFLFFPISPGYTDEAAELLYKIFPERSLASYKNDITGGGERYIAAVWGDELAGLGGYIPVYDEAQITNLAVREDMRQKGVGKGILKALIALARNEGLKSVLLEVRSKNSIAISLYEKCGFKKTGTRKNYYRSPDDDAILMELSVNE